MEEILEKYKSELTNKIHLLGIKNKTNPQIFLQTFKYFDRNSTGYCNYPTFIKVNQKLGIIFNPQDLQKIFFYYDTANEEIINYSDLINDLFNNSNNVSINNSSINNSNNISLVNNSSEIINNKNKNNIPPYKKSFFEKIINLLINSELGPGIGLLVLYQGFILGDKNLEKKLTLNQFVKIMDDNNINFSISDIQMLFHCYNLNNDGFFYYEEMFDDLINRYMNEQRKKIIQKKSEEIMNRLNEKSKGKLNLFLLQKYIFIPKIYSNFFHNKLNILNPNEYYNELINKYLGIKRILNYPRDSILEISNIEEILYYISFGIVENDNFSKAINYIFLSNEESIKKDFNINHNINKKNSNEPNYKISEKNMWVELRKYFVELGLDTFLKIIQKFQVYDRGNTNFISKNNFIKTLNEFEININKEIIDIIFQNKEAINYVFLISDLLNKFIPKEIIKIIENLYNNINISCLKISGKNINLNFISQFSNCGRLFDYFHNIFYEKFFQRNDKKDIYDLINNKNNKKIIIEKDEFIYFYKLLFFFNDETRIKETIYQHWKNVLNDNNIQKQNNKINNNNIKEPEIILKLKSKLKMRGIRGLMNLHKEFIIYCNDLSNISLQDFIKVFENQRLSFTKEEIIKMFNLFKLSEKQEKLNFSKFIRVFKRTLKNERLNILQSAFEKLDSNKNNSANISDIKKNFNAKNDIRILKGEKNEEEILCEFLDCFDLNFNFFLNRENVYENDYINFEEFANFYEYVSFLFDNDEDFIKLIANSWNLF